MSKFIHYLCCGFGNLTTRTIKHLKSIQNTNTNPMKKIFTLLAVAAMAITANAQDPIWLDANTATEMTYSGILTSKYPTIDEAAGTTSYDEVAYPSGYQWDNGVKMYLVKADKTYSGGNSNDTYGKPVKFSNGAPNYVLLPDGIYTNKIEFYGYCNTTDAVTYIASALDADGNEIYAYAEGDPTIGSIAKEDFKGMDLTQMGHITIQFTKAVNTFWFKNGGKQPAVFMNIYPVDPTSALDNVLVADENAPVEYFNLQGVRVENPANGLFIKRQGNTVTKVVVK